MTVLVLTRSPGPYMQNRADLRTRIDAANLSDVLG